MRFDAIRLRQVRRFGEEGLALEGLEPGLNVLARPNEFGKSTILDAVKAALFVPARSKKAQNLVPEGVAIDPYIELEFSTNEGSFRLQKRFAFGKKATMTRLSPLLGGNLLVESTAEEQLLAFIGADEAKRGRPGLLWVGQGDGWNPDFSKDDTATMSSLVSRDLEALSGSAGVERVLAQAEAALFEIEHKTGKPKGLLADALSAIEQHQSAIAAATTAMTRSEQLKADVSQQRRRVKDLQDVEEENRLRTELEAAAADAQAAAQNEQENGHTKQAVARSEQDLAHLEAEYRRIDGAANTLLKNKKSHSMATIALTEAQDRESMAKAVAAEKHTGLQRAAEVLETAEQDREKALRFQLKQRAREDQKRGERELSAARAIMKERQALATKLNVPVVDAAKLEKASAALVRAEAARDAAAAWVRVEASGSEPVVFEDKVLQVGEERPVSADGALIIGETRLVIGRKGAGEPEAQLADVQRRIASLLRQADARSIEEAQEREARRREAERQDRDLKERLKLLAPDGIEALAQRLSAVPEGDSDQEPADLPSAEAALAEARAQHQAAAAAEAAARQEWAAQERLVGELRTELTLQSRDIERLEAELGPESERAGRQRAAKDAVEAARDALGAARHRLKELDAALEQAASAVAKQKRLQQAWDQRQAQKAEAREVLAALEVRVHVALGDSSEAARDEAQQKLSVAEKQRDRLERRRAGLKRLISALQAELTERLETTQAPVMQHLRPMISHVFGEAAVRFDAEWKLEELDRPLGAFAPQALSGGTREQLALLTRFAFAKLAAAEGRPTPLILDDALIFADDDRVEKMFDLLHEVAEETQVIVLTCHERLFSRLGGHRSEPQPFPETA